MIEVLYHNAESLISENYQLCKLIKKIILLIVLSCRTGDLMRNLILTIAYNQILINTYECELDFSHNFLVLKNSTDRRKHVFQKQIVSFRRYYKLPEGKVFLPADEDVASPEGEGVSGNPES
jgi:hypothetical protein